MIEQAVLLAAGKGTRLLPLTEQVPKCMVPVAGRPLVDHLLDQLPALGVKELLVVTGYRAEPLVQHLTARRGELALAIELVPNAQYENTNNILSLHMAAERVRAPFYLLESDIWADRGLLARLGEPDAMAIAPYAASMDGSGVELDAGGVVVNFLLGAHRVARPATAPALWKTVNFYSLSRELWEGAYRPGLAEWVAAGRTDAYYEAVLAELVTAGARLRGVDVSDLAWTEIDDPNDLARAEHLIAAAAAR